MTILLSATMFFCKKKKKPLLKVKRFKKVSFLGQKMKLDGKKHCQNGI